jgi:ankyrin repeat protein
LVVLKYGADIHLKDDDGDTALIYGVNRSQLDKVQALLDAGADVNVKNKDGKTPLMLAQTQYEPEKLIHLLKKAGAKQ